MRKLKSRTAGRCVPAAALRSGWLRQVDTDARLPQRSGGEPSPHQSAGVHSTKPGVLGSKRSIQSPTDREVQLALAGIVPCKVSCENGPIKMGDLLVTSRAPGYAMRGTDAKRMSSAVVGKALQPLRKGRGVIEVLVTLR